MRPSVRARGAGGGEAARSRSPGPAWRPGEAATRGGGRGGAGVPSKLRLERGAGLDHKTQVGDTLHLLRRERNVCNKRICFLPHVLSPQRFLGVLSGVFSLNTNSSECFLYLSLNALP